MSKLSDAEKAMLEKLSEEELFQYYSEKVIEATESETRADITLDKGFTFEVERFYLDRKIVGSRKSCSLCGQSMVNDLNHLIALTGDDESLLQYLKDQQAVRNAKPVTQAQQIASILELKEKEVNVKI